MSERSRSATDLLRLFLAPPADAGERRLLAELESWTPADLASQARALADERPRPGSERLLLLLLREWGAHDGEAAAAFAMGLPRGTRVMALHLSLEGWARHDARAALAWVRSTQLIAEDPGTLDSLVGTIGMSLASRRPNEALQLAAELPDIQAETLRRSAIRELATQGRIAEARAVVEQSLETLDVLGLASSLIVEWGSWDPAAAADWAASLKIPSTAESEGAREEVLLAPLLHGWAARSPMEAIAWLESRPAEANLDSLYEAIAFGWTWSTPEAPEELSVWLTGKAPDNPVHDPFRETLADHLLPLDPEAALEWSLSIVNPDLRARQVGWSLQVWSQRDPDAAARWAEANAARLLADISPPP